jgi:hypothetical protein
MAGSKCGRALEVAEENEAARRRKEEQEVIVFGNCIW